MKSEIKKELSKKAILESWGDLTKDKSSKFAAVIPDMGKEVWIKIVEQVPGYTGFAKDAIQSITNSNSQLGDSNSVDNKERAGAIDKVLQIIKEELDKDDITGDEKKCYMENVMEIARNEYKHDKENKKFLKSLSEKNLTALRILVIVLILIVSGKVVFDGGAGSST